MAVIGAVIGFGIVGTVLYDNHSDYSDYSNYDNYSNYSDAAERRQRRIQAKNKEIGDQKYSINIYKTNSVNNYLQSSQLKQQNGVTVNVDAVKKDGNEKIETDIRNDINKKSSGLILEIDELNNVINKIDNILKENK